MDFYSLGFLFVIVMVSGVIAYLADIVGKKIGKQRRSVFGLRPRHTATFTTVALGMFLSVATIFLLIVFFTPVRQWVLDGSQALNKLKTTQSQLAIEKRELKVVENEKLRLQETKAEDIKKIESGAKTLGAQRLQIGIAQSNIDHLNETQRNLQSELTSTKKEISKKDVEIEQDQKRLDSNRLALKNVNQRFNDNLKRSNKVFHKAQELTSENSALSTTIENEKSEVFSLNSQKEALVKTNNSLLSDLEGKKARLAALQSQVRDDEDRLDDIRKQASKEIFARTQYIGKDFVNTRIKPLIFRRLQEIARIEVGPNLNREEADGVVRSLLARAQMEATAQGARPEAGFKVADIIDRPDGMTAETVKKLLRDQLVGKPEPAVLIAVSSFNSFDGEPVSIDVSVRSNPIVYHRGDVLIQTQLDGSSSDEQIFKELSAFGQAVHERAQEDKMIPQSHEESFGSIPFEDAYSLIGSIKQLGKKVRVQAVALNDTRAADPLKLEFRLK